jgi:hypothetical protein
MALEESLEDETSDTFYDHLGWNYYYLKEESNACPK